MELFKLKNKQSERYQEGENIDKFKELILTNEQYKDTPFASNENQRSYVFELNNGDKKIVYFGSAHTNNLEDPLFREIQDKFKEVAPDMVYIEGLSAINANKDKVRESLRAQNSNESKQEGEAHFTLQLAVDAGIDFESPEPEFSEEFLDLIKKGFPVRDIFRFYMYRAIDQYQRQNKEINIEECKKYLEQYFKKIQTESGWDEKELHMLKGEIFAEVESHNKENYNNEVDPIPWENKSETVLNEISRHSSNFRDRHIFERIVEGLKSHNKLFIVYGSAHAVKQEQALRAFLEK